MATEKQIHANSLNSQNSTGPSSPDGKATSSKNATKHGLLASQTILPWENEEEIKKLEDSLYAALKPVGELETLLADRIVSVTWRLCRAGKLETAVLAWKKYVKELDRAAIQFQSTIKYKKPFEVSFPDEEVIENKQLHDRAQKDLHEKAALAASAIAVLGRTFVDSCQTLALLHRYEVGLEKSLFKTLHELERRQAARKGLDVPPPEVIDVNVDPTSPI